MKYTVKDLQRDFPDEEACLLWLIEWLYPEGITCKKCEKITKHHKLNNRKVYSCDNCGTHVSPCAGTIFHKSRTPLMDWFLAIWLMSSNKAGTSAKQIERELGVTYKTAWRMMHQIRTMMDEPDVTLQGETEIDESYYHANVFKRSSATKMYGPTGARSGQIIFGVLERGTGKVFVKHVPTTGVRVLMPLIEKHIAKGSTIYSDEFGSYRSLHQREYRHLTTNHTKHEHVNKVNPNNYTQTIENFWSTWKPRMKGTFRHVSPKYIEAYVWEYAWRYSHRNDVSMFWSLMGRVGR
jgi:transposase-like protein